MRASALARPEQTLPIPAYQAAVAAGINAALAWFRHPVLSAGDYRNQKRIAYIWHVIDAHRPGHTPLTAALDGFTEGFNRGLAQAIAGGAR
ncbi:hypothetical protein [Kerstersia gyiorum]|uniref:hypothetical protein n=1 Tax=Kerstersia gyiorum TaxID=206506 RepID=UPI001431ECAF|nr:hypothetical protein [Kerstersia gyiorum]